MAERMSLEDAVKRMNEIAEELANGTPEQKGKKIIELRKLCAQHFTVPNAYQLEGVVKDEPMPRSNSQLSRLWKGKYKDQEVALKVFRGATLMQRTRLYREVVLMKQVNHENILPFYGVLATSTTPDFCAVFPWYENGSIMHYLYVNPDIDRYRPLLGAINGLCFLHDMSLVHGALQPSHILIDDDGNARLTATIHSSIIADSGASTSDRAQVSTDSIEETRDFCYSAPEIEWPENRGIDNVTRTRESDVYGMAMVIYEVLTEKQPYHEFRHFRIPRMIRDGEFPVRPPKIDDLVWELLEKCWSRKPASRPKTVELRNPFSDRVFYREPPTARDSLSSSEPEAEFQPTTAEELPGKLRVLVQNIKILVDERKKRRFTVKLAYGNHIYVTAPTRPVDSSPGYTWIDPESWIITTNQQNLGHLVSLRLLQREIFFRKDKFLAEGHFSLLGNVNKPISVNLEAPDGTGLAVLKVFLMEM